MERVRRTEEISLLRRQGYTLQEIGNRLGLSRQGVHQILKKHLADLYPDALTIPQMAQELHITENTIRRACQKLGLEPLHRNYGRVYWSKDTLGQLDTHFKSARCLICGNPVKLPRTKYCSPDCQKKARQSKDYAWRERNPERFNEHQQRYRLRKRQQAHVFGEA